MQPKVTSASSALGCSDMVRCLLVAGGHWAPRGDELFSIAVVSQLPHSA